MSDCSVKRSKSKNRNNQNVTYFSISIPELVVYTGGLFVACSFLVPAYQVYLWLRNGFWKPLTTNIIFSKIMPTEFNHWLLFDSSWLGLKKIIIYFVFDMPLFLLVFLLGSGIIWFAIELDTELVKSAKEHKTEEASEEKKAEGN